MENLQTYIGALAVDKNYINQTQLNECISILDQEESDRTIDRVLLDKKYVNEDQMKFLQKNVLSM